MNVSGKAPRPWNEWREAHPEVEEFDLSGADLKGIDARFVGSSLLRADLGGAALTRATLQDFESSSARDITETIKTLAGLSLFIIADITNPRSAPLELQATVPDYQIPFVPVIEEGEPPFSMFMDLVIKYDWVLPPLSYASVEVLTEGFLRPLHSRRSSQSAQ